MINVGDELPPLVVEPISRTTLALRSVQVRFTAITPVHGQPTCTGTVVSITDGLAKVKLAVTLADGTVTLAGDAIIDLN